MALFLLWVRDELRDASGRAYMWILEGVSCMCLIYRVGIAVSRLEEINCQY